MERSITPIDFRKLLREEKKRARDNRKKKEHFAENDATLSGGESTTADGGCLPQGFSTTVTCCTTLPAWEPSAQHSWNVPMLNRQEHCVCSNPASIYYLPSFVPPQLGQDIWDWLQELPFASVDSVTNSSSLEEPTGGCWHVLPHAKRKVALFHSEKNVPFPPPLQILVDALIQGGVFPAKTSGNMSDGDGPPNHILVNEYTAEQGILPHTDGPAYNSRTATISLGQGNVLLNFVPRPVHHHYQHPQSSSTSTTTRLSTMPSPQLLLHGGGSLVVFENSAYLDYMHSIAEVNVGMERSKQECLNAMPMTLVQRQPRISLTIRRKRHDEGSAIM